MAGRYVCCFSYHTIHCKTAIERWRYTHEPYQPILPKKYLNYWSEKARPLYLKVIAEKTSHALNILDRFHIMKKFNEAIDKIRKGEVRKLKAEGADNVNVLEKSRWLLLKMPENLTEKQTVRLVG